MVKIQDQASSSNNSFLYICHYNFDVHLRCADSARSLLEGEVTRWVATSRIAWGSPSHRSCDITLSNSMKSAVGRD